MSKRNIFHKYNKKMKNMNSKEKETIQEEELLTPEMQQEEKQYLTCIKVL